MAQASFFASARAFIKRLLTSGLVAVPAFFAGSYVASATERCDLTSKPNQGVVASMAYSEKHLLSKILPDVFSSEQSVFTGTPHKYVLGCYNKKDNRIVIYRRGASPAAVQSEEGYVREHTNFSFGSLHEDEFRGRYRQAQSLIRSAENNSVAGEIIGKLKPEARAKVAIVEADDKADVPAVSADDQKQVKAKPKARAHKQVAQHAPHGAAQRNYSKVGVLKQVSFRQFMAFAADPRPMQISFGEQTLASLFGPNAQAQLFGGPRSFAAPVVAQADAARVALVGPAAGGYVPAMTLKIVAQYADGAGARNSALFDASRSANKAQEERAAQAALAAAAAAPQQAAPQATSAARPVAPVAAAQAAPADSQIHFEMSGGKRIGYNIKRIGIKDRIHPRYVRNGSGEITGLWITYKHKPLHGKLQRAVFLVHLDGGAKIYAQVNPKLIRVIKANDTIQELLKKGLKKQRAPAQAAAPVAAQTAPFAVWNPLARGTSVAGLSTGVLQQTYSGFGRAPHGGVIVPVAAVRDANSGGAASIVIPFVAPPGSGPNGDLPPPPPPAPSGARVFSLLSADLLGGDAVHQANPPGIGRYKAVNVLKRAVTLPSGALLAVSDQAKNYAHAKLDAFFGHAANFVSPLTQHINQLATNVPSFAQFQMANLVDGAGKNIQAGHKMAAQWLASQEQLVVAAADSGFSKLAKTANLANKGWNSVAALNLKDWGFTIGRVPLTVAERLAHAQNWIALGKLSMSHLVASAVTAKTAATTISNNFDMSAFVARFVPNLKNPLPNISLTANVSNGFDGFNGYLQQLLKTAELQCVTVGGNCKSALNNLSDAGNRSIGATQSTFEQATAFANKATSWFGAKLAGVQPFAADTKKSLQEAGAFVSKVNNYALLVSKTEIAAVRSYYATAVQPRLQAMAKAAAASFVAKADTIRLETGRVAQNILNTTDNELRAEVAAAKNYYINVVQPRVENAVEIGTNFAQTKYQKIQAEYVEAKNYFNTSVRPRLAEAAETVVREAHRLGSDVADLAGAGGKWLLAAAALTLAAGGYAAWTQRKKISKLTRKIISGAENMNRKAEAIRAIMNGDGPHETEAPAVNDNSAPPNAMSEPLQRRPKVIRYSGLAPSKELQND